VEGDVGSLELGVDLVELVHGSLGSVGVREIEQVVFGLVKVDLVVANPYSDVFEGIQGKIFPRAPVNVEGWDNTLNINHLGGILVLKILSIITVIVNNICEILPHPGKFFWLERLA
jgi:hypothetical protein